MWINLGIAQLSHKHIREGGLIMLRGAEYIMLNAYDLNSYLPEITFNYVE